MEPQTTQSQPPKKSRTRVILIAVGVLIVLCLCVAVAGNMNRDSDAPGTAAQPTAQPIVEDKAPASTPTPIPPTSTPAPPADTPTPMPPTATPTLKQLIVDALGERNRPDAPETTIVNNADSMAVVFPINDNLKTTWVRDVAQRDILNAAQVIYQTTGNAYDVTFTGTFAMQDAYGNVEELPVMRATLTRATLDKINWENLLAVQLSQVADEYEENAGFSK